MDRIVDVPVLNVLAVEHDHYGSKVEVTSRWVEVAWKPKVSKNH